MMGGRGSSNSSKPNLGAKPSMSNPYSNAGGVRSGGGIGMGMADGGMGGIGGISSSGFGDSGGIGGMSSGISGMGGMNSMAGGQRSRP